MREGWKWAAGACASTPCPRLSTHVSLLWRCRAECENASSSLCPNKAARMQPVPGALVISRFVTGRPGPWRCREAEGGGQLQPRVVWHNQSLDDRLSHCCVWIFRRLLQPGKTAITWKEISGVLIVILRLLNIFFLHGCSSKEACSSCCDRSASQYETSPTCASLQCSMKFGSAKRTQTPD